MQGALEGKLGIQQPGWRPGMPVTGGGDGASLFGRPNIELPPAPGPAEHAGTGAPPGPVDQRSIDLSVNFHGPVGSDPDEVRRQAGIAQDRGLAKVAPIDPGHH
jgi:hypothetical protein